MIGFHHHKLIASRMIGSSFLALAVLLFLFSSPPASAQNSNAVADKLRQEAAALAQQAEQAETPSQALGLYRQARTLLDQILDEHTSSRAASRLILGDPLMRRLETTIPLTEEAAKDTEKECWRQPTRACVFDVALATTSALEDTKRRDIARIGIAIAQAEAREFGAAFTTARAIEDSQYRRKAAGRIAVAQAEAGDFEGAFSTARGFDVALIGIAVAQARAGALDAAFVTARSIKGEVFQSMAVARIQAAAGDFEAAFATARSIESEDFQSMVVARIQIEAGDFEAAVVAAGGAKFMRWDVLGEIAIAQAGVGDFQGALATAERIENESYRSPILARVQATAGEIEVALSTARGTGDELARVWALAAIATVLE